MHRPLVPVVADDHEAVLRALRPALDGTGPAVLPGAADDDAVPDDVALVVRTSGTLGEPRAVMLGAQALRASATATHERLAGPGTWVLALPLTHIAGLQVLVRSVLAGTAPVVLEGKFDPVSGAGVVHAMAGPGPRYASLVPTQLHRILAGATPDGTLPPQLRPWAELDAILVGGAASPPRLLERARAAGLKVVTTYGLTETCGGCVYDGVPLAGVGVRAGTGGIEISGAVLARGYLGRPDLDAEAFHTTGGVRWLRTADAGELRDGVLQILGRRDEVLVTGGHNVAPAVVEAALAGLPGVGQVCVVGVTDAEWGQAVTAVVVPGPGGAGPELAGLRAAISRTLGRAAAPRHLVLVDELPSSGPGKVDRAAVRCLAEAAVAAGH